MTKILVIQGGTRSKDSCPGRDTKSRELVKLIKENRQSDNVQIEVIDLAVEGDGEIIQPCKGCIGTSGGFHCHWPCSCYGPGSASEKLPDIMHDQDVYRKMEETDGILILTATQWWKPTGPVLAMLDRLVCASKTITRDDAVLLTNNDFKNPKKTSELEQSGEYDHLMKNHLEGKTAAIYIYGDEGADDYSSGDLPKAMEGHVGAMEDDYRLAVRPIVNAFRYMGIFMPENLIHTNPRGKGEDYSDNDETFRGDKDFLQDPIDLFDALVAEIELKRSDDE